MYVLLKNLHSPIKIRTRSAGVGIFICGRSRLDAAMQSMNMPWSESVKLNVKRVCSWLESYSEYRSYRSKGPQGNTEESSGGHFNALLCLHQQYYQVHVVFAIVVIP